MKILLIGNNYFQQFPVLNMGGTESSVENLANGLYTAGHDFSVIVPKRQITKEYPFQIYETECLEGLLSRKSPIDFITNVCKVIDDNKLRPDVIWSFSDWSVRHLLRYNVPILCSIRDGIYNMGSQGRFVYSKLATYRFSSKHILNNTFNLNNDCQKNIFEKSFQLYTGIDDSNYKFNDNKSDYILWIAALDRGMSNKGLDKFIQLSKMNPSKDFVCGGTGDGEIEKMLYKIDNEVSNFHFIGKVNRGFCHTKLFQDARFFSFMTMREEHFPRVCLESISKGTPILGNTAPVNLEVYDKPNVGFLSNDLEAISCELYKTYDYSECFNYSKKFHISNEINGLIQKSMEIL